MEAKQTISLSSTVFLHQNQLPESKFLNQVHARISSEMIFIINVFSLFSLINWWLLPLILIGISKWSCWQAASKTKSIPNESLKFCKNKHCDGYWIDLIYIYQSCETFMISVGSCRVNRGWNLAPCLSRWIRIAR